MFIYILHPAWKLLCFCSDTFANFSDILRNLQSCNHPLALAVRNYYCDVFLFIISSVSAEMIYYVYLHEMFAFYDECWVGVYAVYFQSIWFWDHVHHAVLAYLALLPFLCKCIGHVSCSAVQVKKLISACWMVVMMSVIFCQGAYF